MRVLGGARELGARLGAWGSSGDGGRQRNRYADAALSLVVLATIGMMIVPLPTVLLDVLIACNLALSVLMLLTAVVVPDALSFGAMPTALLVTTLYRLALNVSSTRLILLQADAGEVIASFGHFVVRGNYAVGAVIFLILTLIQYVVVARGAERVAEVGARFTLDAMPGKQMAIDGDLRAGVLTPEGARSERRALARESQFYGAMDGAMKFVKGDAIAGIAITAVNLVAGVGIGLSMRELSLRESLTTYGLLTIGDGLVSQIPSLLVSVAAGIVVTRVAAADERTSLGRDLFSQLLSQPRVLLLGAGFMGALALVPGLPLLPFALLSLLLGGSSLLERRRSGALAERVVESGETGLTSASQLCIELGPGLSARLPAAALETALERTRSQLLERLGLPLPAVSVRVNAARAEDEFAITLGGVPLRRRGPQQTASEAAGNAGANGADADAIAAELSRVAESHAGELVGLDAVHALLRSLSRRHPALVQGCVPHPVSASVLSEVLARLLHEGVSVRPLTTIVETLARELQPSPGMNGAQRGRDAAALTERVRARLARQLTHHHSHEGVLHVHPVDPLVEDVLRESALAGASEPPALPPDLARDVIAAARRVLDDADTAGRPAVLVTQSDVRRPLRALLEAELPRLAVLAYPEIAADAAVERLTPLRVGTA